MNTGIISSFLVWAAILIFVLRLRKASTSWRILGAIIITISTVIPIAGLWGPLYLRGIIGDLSVVTQLLLANYIINSLIETARTPAKKIAHQQFALFVVITAFWFYPTTLGLTYFDPYSFGYNTSPMHWTILMYFFCGTLIFFYQSLWISGVLCIATLSFCFNSLESNNYWDYMFDPILTLGAIFYLLKPGVRFLKNRLIKKNTPIQVSL